MTTAATCLLTGLDCFATVREGLDGLSAQGRPRDPGNVYRCTQCKEFHLRATARKGSA